MLYRSALALVAALSSALVEMGAATWQWTSRTMEERMAVEECVPLDYKSFAYPRKDWSFPSLEVSQAESHVSVATLISIKYGQQFKVVTNGRSKEQYVLPQCGTNVPGDAEVDAVDALPAGYTRKTFMVPLQKAVAASTTIIAFIDALGVEDRMVAVSPLAVAPCWQKARMECGAALASSYSNQTLMALQYAAADGVFMDCPTSGCSFANGISFSPTADPGNLHGAEYIKVMAAFFNKETEADAIFASKLQTYTTMAPMPNQPIVAWISFELAASWNGFEDIFILSRSDYKLQLVTDAGFVNKDVEAMKQALPQLVEDTALAAGTKYVLKVSDFAGFAEASAAFFGALTDVHAVIDEYYAFAPRDYDINSFYTHYGLTSSSSLPFVANQEVLRIDGTISADDSLDWYESRIANPDRALEGLRRALTGNTALRRKFFRNIAAGEVPEVLTAAMCSSNLPMCGGTHPAAITFQAEISGAQITGHSVVLMLFFALATVVPW